VEESEELAFLCSAVRHATWPAPFANDDCRVVHFRLRSCDTDSKRFASEWDWLFTSKYVRHDLFRSFPLPFCAQRTLEETWRRKD